MKTIISNSIVSATVTNNGAELVSLYSNEFQREYIWEGNPEYWGKHSPILFPIVGTLKNNSYSYNRKSYVLSRHGFAREMVFNLIFKNETKAVFSLKANAETKKVYPFDFELQLAYSLSDAELTITYEIFNKGVEAMFFSIGGHPAFALPNTFDQYRLGFEQNESLTSYELKNDLLSDDTRQIALDKNQLPLTYALFEKDALIFKSLISKQIQIIENNRPILNFSFTDFPNFGIWTKENAPFICLEPWVGYSDVLHTSGNLSDKEGIQLLEGNTSAEFSFSIEIL